MLSTSIRVSAFVLAAPLMSFAATINQIVVFGDSLSDNGNAASVSPGGVLAGNYAPNALTDGPNTVPATAGPFGLWIDQLAAKLGVADPKPFVLPGGTNYAVASAQTGHNPGLVPFTTDQVALYLSSHTPSASSLYAFWAGSNDINQSGTPAAALAAAVTAADNIEGNIQTLAASGAKQFIWLNEPPLGNTPLGRASGPTFSAALNAASQAFNTEWAKDIAMLQAQGIMVTGVNIGQFFAQIIAAPSQFGFVNTTDPAGCSFAQSLPGCASNNPNQFLFWDGEHPTTAADAQIATLAFNTLNAPANVPEPASLGLAFGGLCLGIVLRRTRPKN